MVRPSGLGIAFGAAVASLLAAPRDVSACRPELGGWFVSAIAPVPANGAVVVTYQCNTDCRKKPGPESFRLKTTSGAAVAGSVVLSGGSEGAEFLVFRPEPGELVADREYVPELGSARITENVRVVPDITWTTSITPTEEIFEYKHSSGERVCCDGPLNSCKQPPCFYTEIEHRTAVRVTWEIGSTEERTQYAYRFSLDGDDTDVPWSWNGPSASFELETTTSSVCYTLELQRLADGFVHRLEHRCIEQPLHFTPGIHRRSDEAIADELAACNDPPKGYEAAWCAGLDAYCEARGEPWCDEYPDICLHPDDGEPIHASGGGCATSKTGSNSERATLLFAVGLAALRARRRWSR